MLNTFKYALCAIIAATIFSCDGYLKEDSADLLIPKSVSEYAPILLGEGYPNQFGSQISFVNLMTDDVEMGPLYYDPIQIADPKCASKWSEGIDLKAEYGQYAHIWQQDYSEQLNDKFWSGRYSNILGCNTIIEALPTMEYAESEEGDYWKLAAQAYALRAYHYFCLINTYALPYSPENIDKPGVVLKTSSQIQIAPQKRSTIKQVYDLINDDIHKAQEYISKANFKNSKLEITPEAIYFLASRIALFQNDWDAVIKASERFIALNTAIYDLNNETEESLGFRNSYKSKEHTYCANNTELDEVVFGFARDDKDVEYLAPYNPTLTYYEFGFHPSWDGENALMNLYDKDDLRLLAYFERRYDKSGTRFSPVYYAGQYHPLKYDLRSGINYTAQAWRTPEIYLNLAEAYAQKATDVNATAIELLNKVRINKYKSDSPDAEKHTADFNTKDDLIKFIWEERRRELCFEEIMRFWDMRRQGMPAIEHKLFSTAKDYSVYNLKAGSPNYVLPIPDDETSYNTGIINNMRETIGASSTGSLN